MWGRVAVTCSQRDVAGEGEGKGRAGGQEGEEEVKEGHHTRVWLQISYELPESGNKGLADWAGLIKVRWGAT